MAGINQSLMLVPQECIPGREAIELHVPSSSSVIFPDEIHAYDSSAFTKYDVKMSKNGTNATLSRLLRGVEAFREAIFDQEEPNLEEGERMLAASDLQEGIIKDVGGAITGMARKSIGLLEATFILDDFIDSRDQHAYNTFSKIIADDARFYYALKNGGELPMQAPVEEMVIDYDKQLDALETSIDTHKLAMERLRFEWLTASVVINAVRRDGSPTRYNRALRKGFRLD